MNSYALIGYPLSHSFSKQFFEEKFSFLRANNAKYYNIEIEQLEQAIITKQLKQLAGFNVTTPHKENIINYLDEITTEAKAIGAVNCVKNESGLLVGYNTDYIGFYRSLKPLLKNHKNALVLGSGGASKAIIYALKIANINYSIVSRNSKFDYTDIDEKCINDHQIIINCTPLGTLPNNTSYPPIPYHFLNQSHLLFDLVYNPALSQFLAFGKQKNCTIKNGYEMLKIQAEISWNIWNSKKYNY